MVSIMETIKVYGAMYCLMSKALPKRFIGVGAANVFKFENNMYFSLAQDGMDRNI